MKERPGPTAPGSESGLLPVHGFVLAGGKSSRMGRDKALLPFRGRPLVEIAVEKLRSFCSAVSIAGNRDDLAPWAPVVHEERIDSGPGAGIEAGLKACKQPWALFVPVDGPLVPEALLRRWAASIVVNPLPGLAASTLLARKRREPAFCLVRRDTQRALSAGLDRGDRRMDDLLGGVDDNSGDCWTDVRAAEDFVGRPGDLAMEFYFSNVNTPQDLAEAEAWAASEEAEPMGY